MDHWAKAPMRRDQVHLFTPTLDSSISDDHPVRLLDEILREQDWSTWEAEYDGTRGQPPIAVWIHQVGDGGATVSPAGSGEGAHRMVVGVYRLQLEKAFGPHGGIARRVGVFDGHKGKLGETGSMAKRFLGKRRHRIGNPIAAEGARSYPAMPP